MPRSSSSRRASKWQRQATGTRELEDSLAGMRRYHDASDGGWIVQEVRPNDSGRVYTCPGCRQDVSAASAHIVAWLDDGPFGTTGVENRRHWHKACFASRQRRR